tara:strand:+ start:144 stop:806 length:663 start_codon:yes stop_codon:yes gene_type:complete
MGSTKVALITPTRGDRPLFKDQYWKIIENQTRKPDEVIVVDYPPISDKKDLSARYRKGIKTAEEKGCNIALLWEDDDWYHPEYIEWILNQWEKNKYPDVLGVEETYYYHIKVNKFKHLTHGGRSSAFCCLLKLPYKHSYPHDENIWFDLHLFKNHAKKHLKTKTVKFNDKIYAIGIKHGTGVTGGVGHNTKFPWDKRNGLAWLNQHCSDSEIYQHIAQQI